MSGNAPAARRSVFLPYVVDTVGPFVAAQLVQWFGASAAWALGIAGCVAGFSTAVNTIRRKGLDRFGLLIVLELLLSVVLMVFAQDARLVLIRPSFYTALAAFYILGTLLARRPATFDGARLVAGQGDPVREAVFEKVWDRSAEFRQTHRLMTAGLSLALLADSILRVVIVYRFPLSRSAWLSHVPHVAAIVLFVAASALAGRRFRRIVHEQVKSGALT